MQNLPPRTTLFPYTTLFRSDILIYTEKILGVVLGFDLREAGVIRTVGRGDPIDSIIGHEIHIHAARGIRRRDVEESPRPDRKSTRLNSSHSQSRMPSSA